MNALWKVIAETNYHTWWHSDVCNHTSHQKSYPLWFQLKLVKSSTKPKNTVLNPPVLGTPNSFHISKCRNSFNFNSLTKVKWSMMNDSQLFDPLSEILWGGGNTIHWRANRIIFIIRMCIESNIKALFLSQHIYDAAHWKGDLAEATCVSFHHRVMVNVSHVLCNFIDCFLKQVFQKTYILAIEGW